MTTPECIFAGVGIVCLTAIFICLIFRATGPSDDKILESPRRNDKPMWKITKTTYKPKEDK